MEFFCYHRDRPGSSALRDALLEEHWSYMDQYATQIIARGPTFEGDTPTGSVHIIDLPDPAAARAFAFDEPNYQAGCTGTSCCAVGATRWDAPPVATAIWCSDSAPVRQQTSPRHRIETS